MEFNRFPRIIKAVEGAIVNQSLIPRGSRIAVAFSGGPDSTFLLLALKALENKYDWNIVAVHVDHVIRNESSAEAVRASEIARQLGADFELLRVGVPHKTGQSFEALARERRYAVLNKAADRLQCDVIALGHTRDDNIETVVMNIMRGCYIRGLAGMPYRRGKLVRPLLDLGKQEIKKFLDSHDVNYIIDPSNSDMTLLRNRTRRELLPFLRLVNPAFDQWIVKLMAESRFISTVAQVYADQIVGNKDFVATTAVKAIQVSVLGAILEKICSNNGIPVRLSMKHVLSLLKVIKTGHIPSYISIPGGFLYVTYEQVSASKSRVIPSMWEYPLKTVGKIMLPMELGEVKVEPCDGISCGNNEHTFHIDSLEGLKLGFSRPGAYAYLDGNKVKLKDIFMKHKVPSYSRYTLPIVYKGDNEVVWVANLFTSGATDSDYTKRGINTLWHIEYVKSTPKGS